ncbi:MAG: extracellular solute-binding protein [bacterium]|nr:extracellular solute-binding protein [bacterium]
MTKFQVFFIGGLVLITLVGVMLFATYQGNSRQGTVKVEVWGTIPASKFQEVADSPELRDKTLDFTYRAKSEATFEQELIEALARDAGPDVIILPHERILSLEDKLMPIPYESISRRIYRDSFAEIGDLFLLPEGILAIPFAIDPLVMYWNKDIFSSAGVAAAPKNWEELIFISPQITKKDSSQNITTSAAALGEFRNIAHAREILSALMLQAGTPVIVRQETDDRSIAAVMSQRPGQEPRLPGEAALDYFTEFSNPAKTTYSWNKSLPLSRDQFTAATLAVYFGFASELDEIAEKNPNLNFDISEIPQIRDSRTAITYGKLYGFAILKKSKVPNAAYQAITKLTSSEASTGWSKALLVAPARRSLLGGAQSDAFRTVFNKSAIRARAYISPGSAVLDPIFRDMVESVTAGRLNSGEAVRRADSQINETIRQ